MNNENKKNECFKFNYKAKLNTNPVAYFCMEYATPENLPVYAGGLGVLAGDYLVECYQQEFPLIGVGLLYSKKILHDKNGHIATVVNPYEYELEPICDVFNKRIEVLIPYKDRMIAVEGWLYRKESNPIILLDCNIEKNSPEDRSALELLYTVDPEVRLKQEMILSIGGMRFLKSFGIEPSIFHMNEGHSAFLFFELACQIKLRENISYKKAFEEAREKIVFSNHTLVVGARDIFEKSIIEHTMEAYAREIKLDLNTLYEAGLDPKSQKFSTTNLAINCARKINAVSVLHGKKAIEAFGMEMLPITNGVNISRWDEVYKDDLVESHRANKRKLLAMLKCERGVDWSEHDIIISWARRITGYKRPNAIFTDLERLKDVLENSGKKVKLIISGNPHYNDFEGQWWVEQMKRLAKDELKDLFVFIENYDINISKVMHSGSDVWLNTPIVGFEACGTSTMKAALNGTLLCSTNDGWLPEVNLEEIGYLLQNDNIFDEIVNAIQKKIVPEFSDPAKWQEKMHKSRKIILDNFGTDRMLADYYNKVYKSLI